MDILGNSLEKIAFEKAGIIKPRVPVVIGEALPETKLVFQQKADETCSPIFFAEEKFEIISLNSTDKALEIELLDRSKTRRLIIPWTSALYQAKNLLPVLTAIGLLKNDFTLKENNIQKAMRNVKNLTDFHGRWEVIHRKPLVVLDVAHNADGIQQLINQVNSSSYKKLHIIFGIVKDKEIDKVLERLPPKAGYYFTRAQIPRALPEDELRARAAGFRPGRWRTRALELLGEAAERTDSGRPPVWPASLWRRCGRNRRLLERESRSRDRSAPGLLRGLVRHREEAERPALASGDLALRG